MFSKDSGFVEIISKILRGNTELGPLNSILHRYTSLKLHKLMPLLFSRHPVPDTTFAVWQMSEPEPFFRERLPLSGAEQAELEHLGGLRRQEWLACRWLLHTITGAPQRLPLAKDAFSKPFFTSRPDLFCSLSHSHGLVGALFANCNGGCDLQMEVEKMPRIAPRFLNDVEKQFITGYNHIGQMALFHLFWTMKEALYKAYGLKEVDFKNHFRIAPFEWNGDAGVTTAAVVKDGTVQQYRLYFGKHHTPTTTENALGTPFYWTVALS